MKSPNNQFPMYAENALPAITVRNKDRFIEVLDGRIEGIERESGRKRVEKIIKKAGKI